MKPVDYQLVIVGAGPAGLAAAAAAASAGQAIALVDDNPHSGGQIWRGGAARQDDPRARALWAQLQASNNIHYLPGSRVVAALPQQQLLLEAVDGGAASVLHYQKLIIASGARELFLPFPGWTLPGVSGAGGLQALCKGGFPLAGKRVVVAGSGPLLLAVAATLRQRGALVTHVLEQAGWRQLGGFGLPLLRWPAKLRQAWQLRRHLAGTRYHADSYVLAASGTTRLQQISVRIGGRQQQIECDYLACGYGLLPNTELAAALGCSIDDGKLRVDQHQQSSVPGIYGAGEISGIGGVDLALVEGELAGLAASAQLDRQAAHARQLCAQRRHGLAFSRLLARHFALRPELLRLCQPDTLVCRCEDVPYAALQPHVDWRSAKLHTRCGMGACQGRICGAATAALFGWSKDTARIPLAPTRIASLID